MTRRRCRRSTFPDGRASAKPWASSAMRRASVRRRVSEDRAIGTRRLGSPDGIPTPTWRNHAMKVVVDFDLCESNALCMAAAPEVFEVRDDDFLYVLQDEPGEELRAKVEEAVRRCPKQAISIEG